MQSNQLLVVGMVCLASCVNCPHPDPAPLIESSPPPGEQQVDSEQAAREHHVVWGDIGVKAEEGWVVSGARDGPWTAWHPTGTKKWQGDYRDNDPFGLWRYWDKNGRREKEIEFAETTAVVRLHELRVLKSGW